MNPLTDTSYDFALPISLPAVVAICLALAIAVGLSYRFTRTHAPKSIRILSGLFRWLVCCAVLFLLLRPERVIREEIHPPGRVAVVIDASESMSIEEGSSRRIDAAKQWIDQHGAGWPDYLQPVWFGFSTNLFPAANAGDITAEGAQSKIASSLGELLDQPFAGDLHSVVVVSDGAATPPDDQHKVAARFRDQRIPVYAVAIGAPAAARDAGIDAMEVLAPAVSHAPIPLAVTLLNGGMDGGQTELIIAEAGKELHRAPVQLKNGRQTVRLEVPSLAPGFHALTLSLQPVSREISPHNNSAELGVSVTDQTVRVIYMEASGVQQGVFQPLILKQALESMPGVEALTLYTDQYGGSPLMRNKVAYIDPDTGDRIYRVQHDTKGFPKTMEELLKWDVIINSDIPVSAFSHEQLDMTSKFVTEHGGGFVMIGGHTAFGSGGYHRTVIDQLIPVVMEDFDATAQNTYRPTVLDAAWDHPLLRITEDAESSRAAWTTKFPPLYGYNVVIREKPGAIRLLEHPNQRNQHGPLIILACQEVGAGRSMAFTSDTTFYWGVNFQGRWGETTAPSDPSGVTNDKRYYRQFWANAVRWLAANKKQMEASGLKIAPLPLSLPPDSTVTVSVKLQADAGEAGPGEVTVELVSEDDEALLTKVAPWNVRQQSFQTELPVMDPGRYRVRATRQVAGKTQIDQALLICAESDWEKQSTQARPDFLREFAEGTGGKLLDDPELSREELVRFLTGESQPIIKESRFPIGKPVHWLVLIISLLAGEWLLRRLNRMA